MHKSYLAVFAALVGLYQCQLHAKQPAFPPGCDGHLESDPHCSVFYSTKAGSITLDYASMVGSPCTTEADCPPPKKSNCNIPEGHTLLPVPAICLDGYCRAKTSTVDANDEVIKRRTAYQKLRKASNLCPPTGKPVIDVQLVAGEKRAVIYWFEECGDIQNGQCVRVYDIPGTLSGDILRLRCDIPFSSYPPALDREGPGGSFKPCHFEVDGNEHRKIEFIELPEILQDDSEDIADLVALLPLVEVDEEKHFVKKGKYRSEVHNLLACQGGSCPGRPLSERLVQLLGRSSKNELVFRKLSPRYSVLPRFFDLATYKQWLLDIVDGLEVLHSLGIVHRDLRIDNLLFSEDGRRTVICDLEGRWGQRSAPELASKGLDAGWTFKSDVYAIGHCIECMVYANAPITRQVEWPVPAPLDVIFEACTRKVPEDRPTLTELRSMIEAMQMEAW